MECGNICIADSGWEGLKVFETGKGKWEGTAMDEVNVSIMILDSMKHLEAGERDRNSRPHLPFTLYFWSRFQNHALTLFQRGVTLSTWNLVSSGKPSIHVRTAKRKDSN